MLLTRVSDIQSLIVGYIRRRRRKYLHSVAKNKTGFVRMVSL